MYRIPLLLLAAGTSLACRYDLVRDLGNGHVRGTVVYADATGEMLPAERAVISLDGGAAFVRSDSQGRFLLKGLPAGRHAFTLAHDADGDGVRERALRVRGIELGVTPDGIVGGRDLGTLVLATLGAIEARVVRGTVPVARAQVVLVGRAAADTVEGVARFDALPPGTYRVGAMVDGAEGPTVTAAVETLVDPGDTSVVTLDLDTLPTFTTGTLSGIARRADATDHGGIAIHGVAAGPPLKLADTDGSGKYGPSQRILAGIYTVVASAPDRRDTVIPFVLVAGDTTLDELLLALAGEGCLLLGDGAGTGDSDLDGIPDDREAPGCKCVPEGSTDTDDDGLCDPVDPDRDGDGRANFSDNCADVLNPGQEDGDRDGIGDDCDTERPPRDLAYPGAPFRFTKGIPIEPVVPTVGGSSATFTVEPALPGGLLLDDVTGTISGRPDTLRTATTYTVRATNTAGETSATFELTVIDVAPARLRYGTDAFSFLVGAPIEPVTPAIDGTPVSWSVAPALPTGLSIDAATGVLSGTPEDTGNALDFAIPATYVVTATNTGGSTSTTLTVTITEPPPAALAYPGAPFLLTKDAPFATVTPTITGTPRQYRVAPALPDGLSIDTSSGALSGRPTVLAPTGTYRVTASNTAGESAFDLVLTVVDPAPTGMYYASNAFVLTKGVTAFDAAPTVLGGPPETFTIEPALPAGLGIDLATGRLTGTPTQLSPTTTYTVTATNTGGLTGTTFTITVIDVAPSLLAYGSGTYTFTEGTAIDPLVPTVTGVPTAYGVVPALPGGLLLDATTGGITGVPTGFAPASGYGVPATYVVTASNTGGGTDVTLQLTVIEPAPTSITYAATSLRLTPAVAMSPLTPTVAGSARTFTSDRPLPAGLSLDPATGVLSGTPTTATPVATYTITAGNSGGTVSYILQLEVGHPPPTNLSYGGSAFTFVHWATITPLTASHGGGPVTSYSVAPALPTGVVLDTGTGTISGAADDFGAATDYAQPADYVVTATGPGGSTSVTLAITVRRAPPSNLSYPGAPFALVKHLTQAPLLPTISGDPATFAITPALPAPLSFDTITGAIAGKPTAVSPNTRYTITATNVEGSTSVNVDLRVRFMRPFAELRPHLLAAAAQGTSATETYSNIGLGGGGDMWIGGVLAPNGIIHGFLDTRTAILRIDPVAGSVRSFGATGGGFDQFPGGVLAPNDRIYSVGQGRSEFLVVDPVAETTSAVAVPAAGATGSVVAENGKIYSCPRTVSSVLVIDPADDSSTTIPTTTTGYLGGVLAPNGKIYCMPLGPTNVLVIDPATNTTTTFPAAAGYWGGVLGVDGKIYAMPGAATQVGVIDPDTNTWSLMPTNLGATAQKWFGGVAAPNGRIYGIPRNDGRILVIDPLAATVTTIVAPAGTNKWYGGTMHPNGRIYGIPQATGSVLVIDTKSVGSWPEDAYLSPYYNKL